MLRLVTALVALGLFACGGAQGTPRTGSTADPALAISDLKFYKGDNLGGHLHPDGRLEILAAGHADDWHMVGVLTAAGTLTNAQGKVSQLHDDGWFTGINGKAAPFMLKDDTLFLEADGKPITIDDRGVFVAAAAPIGKFRVEGASDVNTRRTALLIFGLRMFAVF